MVVCLLGAYIEAISERIENIVGSRKDGSVLIHVGTDNVEVEREGTTTIVRKYRQLVRSLKQTRVEQVNTVSDFTSNREEGSEISKLPGMAINMLVRKLCRKDEVRFVDLRGSFVGRADMYMKDGHHLSEKGAAVFADELSAARDSCMGSITHIFGSKYYLNISAGGYLEVPQAEQEAISTDKPIKNVIKQI